MPDPTDLQAFAIPDRVRFATDPAGRPLIRVDTPGAHARISLYGAQVVAYRPDRTQADLLFMSDRAIYRDGKALRGGIPICWPWFGPSPAGEVGPAHGFARLRRWQLLETRSDAQHTVTITLGLPRQPAEQFGWSHIADVRLSISVGPTLTLMLTTTNRDTRPLILSEALHSYFAVANLAQVRIPALAGCDYIDKVAGDERATQQGPLTWGRTVDRIYLNAPRTVVMEDPAGNRSIRIETSGARHLVLWNPGTEGAASLDDLDADASRHMLCVEAANTACDPVTLGPGERHTLALTCSVEA